RNARTERAFVVSNPRERPLRHSKLVPVGNTRCRWIPLQDVVIFVRQEAVQFTQQSGALVGIECHIVLVADLVDSLVLEAGYIVCFLDVSGRRMVFGSRTGKNSARSPGAANPLELL